MSLTYALGSDQFEQVLHMYGDERIESILLKTWAHVPIMLGLQVGVCRELSFAETS